MPNLDLVSPPRIVNGLIAAFSRLRSTIILWGMHNDTQVFLSAG
jgi:hypothetical protein